MSEPRDPLVPFDDETIERVAGQSDVTVEGLRDLLVRHQQQMRNNPGVEDLVYEWRTQFHESPVLHQTEEAYYLRLRKHVWDEFADALDIPEVELYALVDVHDQQTRQVTGAGKKEHERLMIVTRE